MAGHSHSANIAHRKNAQDAARGKIFQKLSKEISVAAQAGTDPDSNPSLKLAIAKAKSKNMPKDNIERAIAKAKGDKNGSSFVEMIFNATVSGGATFIVVTLSDNVNRVRSNVAAYFNKQNASLGKTGTIPFPFEKKGILEFAKDNIDEEALTLIALENGVEEIETEGESYVLITSPENYSTLQEAIINNFEIENFMQNEVLYIPSMYVEYDAEKRQKLLDFVEKLKDDDDVQEVYHNIETN